MSGQSSCRTAATLPGQRRPGRCLGNADRDVACATQIGTLTGTLPGQRRSGRCLGSADRDVACATQIGTLPGQRRPGRLPGQRRPGRLLASHILLPTGFAVKEVNVVGPSPHRIPTRSRNGGRGKARRARESTADEGKHGGGGKARRARSMPRHGNQLTTATRRRRRYRAATTAPAQHPANAKPRRPASGSLPRRQRAQAA